MVHKKEEEIAARVRKFDLKRPPPKGPPRTDARVTRAPSTSTARAPSLSSGRPRSDPVRSPSHVTIHLSLRSSFYHVHVLVRVRFVRAYKKRREAVEQIMREPRPATVGSAALAPAAVAPRNVVPATT